MTEKKLFIVAPHFPPSALPPSQRVRLLIKHALPNGFYPYVFTVSPNCREELSDEWMVELLGQDYTSIEVKCFNPKLTRRFGLGDLGLRMLPFLFFKLWQQAKKIKPEFILYPVPPWYILIIAPIIKRLTGVKYGIDFIDPWVHEQPTASKNFKYTASQWIAKNLEGWVSRHASVIFSVSEGINSNLVYRHPELAKNPMYAVPYGAESSDFSSIPKIPENDSLTIRYIGAIWSDCYLVLDGLMTAFANLKSIFFLTIEFYGTSYAGEGLAKPQLDKWFIQHKLDRYAIEYPMRVPYRRAVELTMGADILFLIGGMQPYYAASKLMGLIVSGKPFIAFVHKDSFPAQILKELDYPYLVTYSHEEMELPIHQVNLLTQAFQELILNKSQFVPLDSNHPLVRKHTAQGMAKVFLENIKNVIS